MVFMCWDFYSIIEFSIGPTSRIFIFNVYIHNFLGGTNNFVAVYMSSSSFTPYMYCQFLNLNVTSTNRCFVQVYTQTVGEPCRMEAAQKITMLKGANSSTDIIRITLRAIAHDEASEMFCFSALASNLTFKVAIEGNFSIETGVNNYNILSQSCMHS